MYNMDDIRERVILVGVDTEGGETAERSLDELAELAATAGAEVTGRLIQTRECVHPATYIGRGKLIELKELLWETEATGIICDDELSSTQLGNLEEELDCKVLDRTLLILDIFAARAVSGEGKIQVELAQLRYRASRLDWEDHCQDWAAESVQEVREKKSWKWIAVLSGSGSVV